MSDVSDSPEYELVRLLARARLDEGRIEALAGLVDEVEWSDVLVLARHHRLLPLLWIHLNEHAQDRVPAGVLRSLHRFSLNCAVQVLFLASEMGRIARRFEEDEIPFLVLKGPSLAEAYGSMAHRPFVDNDALVRRSDFSRVERTLLDLGFNQRKRSQRQLEGYLFINGEYTFGRSVGGQISTMDVHTSVAPYGYSYDGSYENLIGRTYQMDVGGQGVRVLGWPDLFLVLSVNALKDQWNRLRLASDLAEVGAFIDDWDELEALARKERSLRAYRTSVLVATDEVGASFPQDVVARARADRRVAALASDIRAHFRTFHEERVMSGGDRAKLVLQAQDDVRGQIRYLSYVVARRLTERLVSPYSPEEEATLRSRTVTPEGA